MTVAMYARRKRWPLEAVTVTLRHSKIHAADCEACETKDARIDLAIGAYQRAGGNTVTITTTVADLTGRPPRTVAEFVQEHAAVFRG